MIRQWVAAACCLASVAMAGEPDARTLVERANAAYASEDYATALEGYRQAEVTLPESPELAYDRGLAHYKLGEFTEARDYFNRCERAIWAWRRRRNSTWATLPTPRRLRSCPIFKRRSISSKPPWGNTVIRWN